MKRIRKLKKALRLAIILAISLTIAILIIIFSLAPSYVDKRFNLIGNQVLTPISSETKSLHDSLTIVDLHADSLLWGRDLSRLSNYGHVDIPRLIKGNVALQIFASVTKVPNSPLLEGNKADSDSVIKLAILQRWPINTWFSLTDRAIYKAQRLEKFAQKIPNKFRIIKTQSDLNNYLAQRKKDSSMTAGLLGIEGAHALDGNINNLDRLYKSGFRVIGLAHFFDNEVGASAHGISQKGLTTLGREAIKRIDQLNLIIDLAHASEQTINDVLQITNRPVIVSHTGVKGTCAGVRNLSDEQIKQVANTGGVIGIGFWKTAVCGEDVNALVKAIRYVVEQVGVEHVALGSDFDGAVRVPFDVAQMNQITQALLLEGFDEEDIRKIMGLNVIRLLQQYLPR